MQCGKRVGKVETTERERAFVKCFTLQMTATVKCWPGEARSQELHPVLHMGGRILCTFAIGGILICYATMPACGIFLKTQLLGILN